MDVGRVVTGTLVVLAVGAVGYAVWSSTVPQTDAPARRQVARGVTVPAPVLDPDAPGDRCGPVHPEFWQAEAAALRQDRRARARGKGILRKRDLVAIPASVAQPFRDGTLPVEVRFNLASHDGETFGVRISGVDPKGSVAAIGFEIHDVIGAVNGRPTTNFLQAEEAYNAVHELDVLCVDVLRAGTWRSWHLVVVPDLEPAEEPPAEPPSDAPDGD